MKLKEIQRTSTFAWSPDTALPLLATGTVAGALDASFSNDSQLEIWDPDFMNKSERSLGGQGQRGPTAAVTTSSRFNRLAWGAVSESSPRGIIAAGMDNGELGLWDPAKILSGADISESLILRNTTHAGTVRALDFNPLHTNLLSSGGVKGEIYIWDLKDPTKPYSPGARSTKLDEITALSWNAQVPHVLATSSSTGYTVVWDLRGKREVVSLQYGGGAGTIGGSNVNQGGGALAVGGRRGMSDVAWHPDNATRLVTSSEDDSSPIIMVWDLRNARAPEKILTGHDKGVLSLSWCKQDADLLLSCGKDNRALCWNPQTSEIIGELPTANNWAFQVEWSPRNPDLLATAYFDGTIGIHSLQSTNDAALPESGIVAPRSDGADLFDEGFAQPVAQKTLSLKQPPKWLRRPSSSSFGFGGKLVSVSNLPSAQGTNQSRVVHLRHIVTEDDVVQRAKALQSAATSKEELGAFCEKRGSVAQASGVEGVASWKALFSLFKANTRDELVTLLGFSKEEVAAQVAAAVKKLKVAPPSIRRNPSSFAAPRSPIDAPDATQGRVNDPVVSFAEPERDEAEAESEITEGYAGSEGPQSTGAPEPTPSEISGSATSDFTKATTENESTATEPSLFGDDIVAGTPQTETAADFFSSMGSIRNAVPEHVLVPHHSYAIDSSVAATVGSRASSVASEPMKSNTFKIYPNDESDIDHLVTKSLVLGDFEAAVSLCLSADRFADAILLSVRGGPELLERTQTAYFERHTTSFPYLRLFQSVVTNDLSDVVQNADLGEWKEIFVILCTFAKEEEFAGLAKQLGQRLEFQGQVVRSSDTEDSAATARELRKNATLCYLVAGKLEKLVNIWVEEMTEEESAAIADESQAGSSRYAVHSQALQTLIEKVTIFRSAVDYADADLDLPAGSSAETDAGVRSYKLAELYNRYYEYADLLATQGLVQEAIKYVELSPPDYKGASGSEDEFEVARDQLLQAANASLPSTSKASTVTQNRVPPQPANQTGYQYPTFNTPSRGPAPPAIVSRAQATATPSKYVAYPTNGHGPAPTASNPYGPAPNAGATSNSYQPTQNQAPSAYQPAQNQPYTSNGGYNNYNVPSHTAPPPPPHMSSIVPPPPAPITSESQAGGQGPPPPPASQRRDIPGWNDAPTLEPPRRALPNLNLNKVPAPITSPFPNAAPSPAAGGAYGGLGQANPALPPPPSRGASQTDFRRQQTPPPPPPRGPSAQGAPRPPPNQQAPGPQGPYPPQGRAPPYQVRPGSTGPGAFAPPRVMSPLNPGSSHLRHPPQGPPPHGPPGQHRPPPPQSSGSPPPQGGRPSQYAPSGPQPYGGPPQPGGSPPQGRSGPPGQPHLPSGPPSGFGRGAPPGPGNYPPPSGSRGPPPPTGPPGPPGPPGPLRSASQTPAQAPSLPSKTAPLPPKFAPGDRSHIPDSDKPIWQVLSTEINRLKQVTPPQQKRAIEDTERRLNTLFDALNAETISRPVVDQLGVLVQSIAAHDQHTALVQHVDLLTQGSRTDDIGLWMSGVKQVIIRL